MKKDYWAGSQGAWRANAAYSGRELRRFEQVGGSRGGYFALAAAFVTVAVGSVGATVLAMSLLAGSGDSKTESPEQAVRASIVTPAAASENSERKTIDPAAPATATTAAALPSPAAVSKPASSEPVVEAPAVELAATPESSVTAAGSMQVGHDSPAAEEVDLLASNDPRWAQGAHPARSIDALRSQGNETARSFDEADARPVDAARAMAEALAQRDEDQDPEQTAAIAAPAQEKPKAAPAKATGRTATLRTASNLRSGPNKNAGIIGTVPARVAVQLVGCKSWCEIIYKGKRGFVYSGFLGNGGATVRKAATEIRQRTPAPVAKRDTGNLPGVASPELPKIQPADGSHSTNRGG